MGALALVIQFAIEDQVIRGIEIHAILGDSTNSNSRSWAEPAVACSAR